MTKKSLSFILLLLLGSTFLPLVETVEASAQFSTGYDISFVFADNGQATVTQKIALTNLVDGIYAHDYTLTFKSNKITNVSGSDGSGSITVTTTTKDKSTTLQASLNQKVVGKNKTVYFQINYSIDSLAIKRGRVWEINIPQIVTSENVSSYKLAVSVPDSFGQLGRISPNPDQTTQGSGYRNYIYTQKPTSGGGIGASFGDYQLFKFTLKYRYRNTNLYSAHATIALPPDTEYQAVYYQSLEPRPDTIAPDENGNYLATYTVKSGKTLEITASGYAKLVDAETPFQIPQVPSKSELTQFTKSDRFIQTQNPQIQKQAKALKDIKAIYDYVVSTLKYDYNRLNNNDKLGRRGALATLNNPSQSICTDFSDLFVALARAKGIPARGLIGFAYADNSDLRPTKVEGLVDTTVLHAWPEYYDSAKGHWVQVDPTWGNTTGGVDYFNRLDTNHFVFSIYGTSSEFPYPAGSYKLSPNEVDDVKVEIVDQTFDQAPSPQIDLASDQVIAGFPSNAKITLTNNNGRALFRAKLVVGANSALGLESPKTIEVGTLLPFAKNTYPLRLRSSSLFDNGTEALKMSLAGVDQAKNYSSSTEKDIEVSPFFSFETPQVVLLIIFIIVVVSWIAPRLPVKTSQTR